MGHGTGEVCIRVRLMKKVAIDLTWVRPNKVGGTESCVRNLLDGFSEIDTQGWKLILLLSKDNSESFQKYIQYECFELDTCNVNSASQKERVIWQNTKMGTHLRNQGISLCLEPVYGKPFFGVKGIDFITTIHDLQAYHFPQYFSKGRVAWMKLSWKNAITTSKKIIAISNYVKEDIEKVYPQAVGKVQTIYDAVDIDINEVAGTELLDNLKVKTQGYYYTVSSMFLHKNLKTIVLAIAELKKRRSDVFFPLVVSGIGGRKRDELDQLILENDVKEDIIFTSFVSNAERNMLYQNCRVFLFPSIFEGFGMPPLEAAAFGAPVLTTRCTSIEEITGGLLNYVENPLDVNEWVMHIEDGVTIREMQNNKILEYLPGVIAKKYIALFNSISYMEM